MPSDLQVSNIRDLNNANSAITIGSDGQITVNQDNPTITLGSNTTFPTKLTDRSIWYYMINTTNNVSDYLTSNNIDENTTRINGCAPTGFTSINEIKAFFISSSSDPGVWSPIGVGWKIGSDGNVYNQHTKSFNVTTSGAFVANYIRMIDIYNYNNDGADFEDIIAENDVFGMSFSGINTSAFLGGLGLKITWRF